MTFSFSPFIPKGIIVLPTSDEEGTLFGALVFGVKFLESKKDRKQNMLSPGPMFGMTELECFTWKGRGKLFAQQY